MPWYDNGFELFCNHSQGHCLSQSFSPIRNIFPFAKALESSLLLILRVSIKKSQSFIAHFHNYDVTAAMLVFQHKRMAAMMVYQINPLGFKLYFCANTFLFQYFNMAVGHVSENALYHDRGRERNASMTKLLFRLQRQCKRVSTHVSH